MRDNKSQISEYYSHDLLVFLKDASNLDKLSMFSFVKSSKAILKLKFVLYFAERP